MIPWQSLIPNAVFMDVLACVSLTAPFSQCSWGPTLMPQLSWQVRRLPPSSSRLLHHLLLIPLWLFPSPSCEEMGYPVISWILHQKYTRDYFSITFFSVVGCFYIFVVCCLLFVVSKKNHLREWIQFQSDPPHLHWCLRALRGRQRCLGGRPQRAEEGRFLRGCCRRETSRTRRRGGRGLRTG